MRQCWRAISIGLALLSVCPSVRLSVCPKHPNISSYFLRLSVYGSPIILVFPYWTSSPNSDGDRPYRGIEYGGGIYISNIPWNLPRSGRFQPRVSQSQMFFPMKKTIPWNLCLLRPSRLTLDLLAIAQFLVFQMHKLCRVPGNCKCLIFTPGCYVITQMPTNFAELHNVLCRRRDLPLAALPACNEASWNYSPPWENVNTCSNSYSWLCPTRTRVCLREYLHGDITAHWAFLSVRYVTSPETRFITPCVSDFSICSFSAVSLAFFFNICSCFYCLRSRHVYSLSLSVVVRFVHPHPVIKLRTPSRKFLATPLPPSHLKPM